jgi:hypothetical protein
MPALLSVADGTGAAALEVLEEFRIRIDNQHIGTILEAIAVRL